MIEKLTEKIPVQAFLTQIHCPNKTCPGLLTHDNVTRTENGVHGGPQEYRHRCATCNAGYWLKEQYPKVTYEAIPITTVTKVVVPMIVDTDNG